MEQQNVPAIEAAPPEVVGRLLRSMPSLSPQLRKAARYVLDHPREVGVSSISALAAAAGVTPNTLVRMARAVGFEGYEGFREPFRELIRSGRPDFRDRARWLQSIARGGRHGELLREMASGAIANVETLYESVTAPALKRAADRIVAAHATYVLGVGVSHGVARNFAYLAGMALGSVVAIPKEGGLPVDDLVRAGERDLLLVANFQPYRSEVVLAVEAARGQGVPIIAISDSVTSPVALGAEQVFCVPTESPQFFTSIIAVAALFETLMAFVIADASDDVVASIERYHRRRHELGVYWDEES